ncbi:hypothetical protein SAMN04488008_10125 [Maribacter orientalis]|uniref:Uncharacterized protein n=1 Tax=Maribacter orientalis TaxID=228957 RepID=A0A1H7F0T7_9FLAO|nr:hypothetical protein SAMN04488008_10125 [Maribacter orientalis]
MFKSEFPENSNIKTLYTQNLRRSLIKIGHVIGHVRGIICTVLVRFGSIPKNIKP